MATPHWPVHADRRALKQLGSDLKTARLRRNLPIQVVAERASTTRREVERLASAFEHSDLERVLSFR